MLDKILKKGGNPNIVTDTDLTPLMLATYMNLRCCAVLLLEHGADVNYLNRQGYTVLHNAAWDGCDELLSMYLGEGGEHDRQAQDGNTPLSLACHGRHFNAVQTLLALGCNVNVQDKDNDTPLHYAAYNGCLDTVKALCEKGAAPDSKNRLHTTPLWNAVYNCHESVVSYLLTWNPDLSVRSCGIQQHAQTEAVTVCYTQPRSILFTCGLQTTKSTDNSLKCLEALIAAGVDFSDELWLFNEEKPSWLNWPVGRWLLEQVKKPRSLIAICRHRVRDILRDKPGSLRDQVKKLEIPDILRLYLLTIIS